MEEKEDECSVGWRRRRMDDGGGWKRMEEEVGCRMMEEDY